MTITNRYLLTFQAFGWDFDIRFDSEDGESVEKIYRGKEVVEEGSDLEDELLKALYANKRYQNFVSDTWEEFNAADFDEPDWGGEDQYDDAADALARRDDEAGQ